MHQNDATNQSRFVVDFLLFQNMHEPHFINSPMTYVACLAYDISFYVMYSGYTHSTNDTQYAQDTHDAHDTNDTHDLLIFGGTQITTYIITSTMYITRSHPQQLHHRDHSYTLNSELLYYTNSNP